MSDRYRPPSGPKGPRGAAPPTRNNRGGSSSRPHYHGPPLPQRYKERDNYRPNLIEKQKQQVPQGGSSSRDTERPSGPSGYRDGPNTSQKRSHPDSRQGKNSNGPNKRRDFNHREVESNSRSERVESSSRRADVNLAKAPRGPRMANVPDKKPKPKKSGPGGGPGSGPGPGSKRLRLMPHQIYSVYAVRSSDLYKRVQQVGEGTYGKVYKAINEVTGENVAIKKLRLETEREGFPITAMREIKLLQSFDHPNIVGLLEMMVEYNQITMVFDYLNHDLTGLLTLPELTLTEGHRKMIFKQLMTGLDYLHKMRVIHRDIKGSNILLNSQGILKIADFGLARNMKVLRGDESPDYTNRVITIWYRPPELLMGSTDYGREVDIWGVGCLLIELYTKTAIFQGTEELSQLYRIYEVMGTPTAESWPGIENLPWFEMLKPRLKRSSRFEKDFKGLMTEDSFDLAQKMLSLHPGKRITADEALKHPYFHQDPQPEALAFMKNIVGEWHEFETKKRRRDERKRISELKNTRRLDGSVPPSVGKPVQLDSPSLLPRSISTTPFEKMGSGTEESPKQKESAQQNIEKDEGNGHDADALVIQPTKEDNSDVIASAASDNLDKGNAPEKLEVDGDKNPSTVESKENHAKAE
ncbi:hypothetical protein JCM33374_g4550 [Metschnikowia sp. JCM 33374]|nr:hypothetical protein JCM33374_g4550 [Metschnikowia sp. JCM 33374]